MSLHVFFVYKASKRKGMSQTDPTKGSQKQESFSIKSKSRWTPSG